MANSPPSPANGEASEPRIEGPRGAVAALLGGAEGDSAAPVDELSMIGADLRGRDFSGADLAGRDLSRANLEGVSFVGANLAGAVLVDVQADGAEFAGANLKGARLERGRFSQAGFGAADLSGVRADGGVFQRASFVRALLQESSFVGADLGETRWTGADLAGADMRRSDLTRAEMIEVSLGGARFDDAEVASARISRVSGFRTASWLGIDAAVLDRRGANFLHDFIQDQNFIREFRSQGRMYEWTYRLWWLTSDCGRSALRWGLCSAFIAAVFAAVYARVNIDFGVHETFLSPLYFSVVTLTTLGFGDAVPASATAQVVVMAEVTIGYVMLGGLLSLVSTKLSRRAL